MSDPKYDDLHSLLDSLTGGEHVKATWTIDKCLVASEGPVSVEDRYCECCMTIRWEDGEISSTITSFEVTRTEEVTATRDDEDALHALLDSLTDGQEVTAEWRNENGSMAVTGTAMSDQNYMWVRGPVSFPLRSHDGNLDPALHSVTVRRPIVQRWEREDDE